MCLFFNILNFLLNFNFFITVVIESNRSISCHPRNLAYQVYVMVLHDVLDVNSSQRQHKMYHRSCYKLYTSSNICNKFKAELAVGLFEQTTEANDLCVLLYTFISLFDVAEYSVVYPVFQWFSVRSHKAIDFQNPPPPPYFLYQLVAPLLEVNERSWFLILENYYKNHFRKKWFILICIQHINFFCVLIA